MRSSTRRLEFGQYANKTYKPHSKKPDLSPRFGLTASCNQHEPPPRETQQRTYHVSGEKRREKTLSFPRSAPCGDSFLVEKCTRAPRHWRL